jgi:hypothetical protein
MTGVLVMPDGTNSAPSIANTGDTNTGMFFGAADTVSFTAGGTKRLDINTTGIDVTGNMVVSGTVDGVDIAARDSVLTSTTTTANAALPKAGGTMTGTTAHGDGVASTFGDSADLTISHAGGSTYLTNTTGSLILRTDSFRVLNTANSEQILHGNADGSVVAYHNNAEKLATTSTGIDVTGTVTADGLKADSPLNTLSGLELTYLNSTKAIFSLLPSTGEIRIGGTQTNYFPTFYSSGGEAMRIDSSGKVGIGLTNPSDYYADQLVVSSPNNGGFTFVGATNAQNYIMWADGTSGADAYRGYIGYNHADNAFRFGTSGTEAMRIDSSGNVGIGTSSPTRQLDVSKAGAAYIRASDTSSSVNMEMLAASSGGWIGTQTNHSLNFQTNNTERMRIDSSGSVGIGVVPEAWGSNADAMQIGNSGMLFGQNNANVFTTGSNFYWDNTNYKRINADLPSRHVQFQGAHIFGHAVSGSADTNITWLESMRIDSSGNVGIGTSSPGKPLDVVGAIQSRDGGLRLSNGTTFKGGLFMYNLVAGSGSDYSIGLFSEGEVFFATAGAATKRVIIDASGALLVGKTAQNSTVAGTQLNSDGLITATRSGGAPLLINRLNNDGSLVVFQHSNSTEGSISVSGSTVSYNAFSGSHWSRLTDNSQPTILKGTLIETIDEMCDWYQAQFTIPATTRVNEAGETVEDIAAQPIKEYIALPDDASVGDTISYTYNGVTYSATIVKEGDNKHTKCKISDTADSIRVYGVFAAWDNDDDTVNDMYVTAVGTHVVRVHGGQTVSAGDLLVSNGDGTAKVQDDDIIRSKTLGKVLTNIKQETYADNSYTVPCALYCG